MQDKKLAIEQMSRQQSCVSCDFHQSSRHKKGSREPRYQSPRAWDILTSDERRFISGDRKKRKESKTRPIMCIGESGTCNIVLPSLSHVFYNSIIMLSRRHWNKNHGAQPS